MKRFYLLLLALCLPLLCAQETYIPNIDKTGGGNTYYSIGAGETLELPGYWMRGDLSLGTFGPQIGNCLSVIASTAPVACAGGTISHRAAMIPFDSATFVDTCFVTVTSVGGYVVTDNLYLQLVVVDPVVGIDADLGDPFRITNLVDLCAGGAGTSANCTTVVGTYLWQVDGAVSGLTSDVGTPLTSGVITIRIDPASSDAGAADGYFNVICTGNPVP